MIAPALERATPMLALAFKNLFRRRARTALAALGLTIALLGIIALISLSSGIQRLLEQTLELVPGIIVLRKETPSPVLSRLETSRLPAIEGVDGVASAIPQVFFPASEIDDFKLHLNPDPFKAYIIVGVDADKVAALPDGGLFARSLLRGRANRGTLPEVMVPADAVDAFKKDLGSKIRIVGRELEVVGVFRVGSLLLDRGFIMPVELARDICKMPKDQVSGFYVEVDEGRDPKTVAQAIEAALPDVRARTTEDTSREFEGAWAQVDLLLAAIAAIAVVVGAVGIVNTMLMSVIERTRELGVLRAVGWRRGDVIRLIILESAVLGCLGGVAGCALGSLGVLIASFAMPLQPVASPALLASCFGLSIGLGALGGVYPAWRAANLDPIEAIRA